MKKKNKEKTIEEVLEQMTQEQQDVVFYLIGCALGQENIMEKMKVKRMAKGRIPKKRI